MSGKRAFFLLQWFLLGSIVCNGVILFASRPLVASGSVDFMHLYVSGMMVRSGKAAQLYDDEAQLVAQRPFSAWVRAHNIPYTYLRPAFETVLFVPLSYLRYSTAFIIWDSVNVLILLVIPWLLRTELTSFASVPYLKWLLLLFGFFPAITVLGQGQDDILLLFLLSFTYLSIRRGKFFAAGSWLGLASFRIQFVLPLLCILLCGGEWSLLSGFLVVVFALMAATAAAFGWRMVVEYAKHLWWFANFRRSHHAGDPVYGIAPNIRGLWSGHLGTHFSESGLIAGLLLLSIIAFALAAWNWSKWRNTSPALAFTSALIAMMLVSYHAFVHDLVLLMLALLLQLNWVRVHRVSNRSLFFLFLAPAVLFVTAVCFLLLKHAAFNLYSLLLFIWLIELFLVARANSLDSTPGSTLCFTPTV